MPKLVVIDQGSYAVKAAVYQTVGRGLELIGRYHQAVPQAGEAVTEEQCMVALDALLEEHEDWLVSTNCVVSWSGDKATFKRIVLPFTDQAKVVQALPFAVEGEVPFDMDDMVLASRIVGRDQKTEVLVALADEEAVRARVEMFNERGLDPSGVIIDADTAGAWGDEERVVAVIDAGHEQTTVSIVRGGVVHYCRTLSVAGAHFTRAIQVALECDWVDAEALKHGEKVRSSLEGEPAIATEGIGLPAKAQKAMDGTIGLFLASVRSTLLAGEDELGCEVDEVCFTGGSSRLSSLWDYLGQDLGVPVRRVSSSTGDPVPGAFAVTEALAMQQVGLCSKGMDLRVGNLAFKGSTDALRAMLTYGVTGVACFALAAVLLFVVQSAQLKTENDKLDQLMAEMVGASFPDLSPLELADPEISLGFLRENTMIAVEQAEVLSEEDTEPYVVGTLLDLTEAMPPHPQVVLNVTDLQLSRKILKFDAELEAESAYAMAEEIVTALQKNKRFSRIKSGEDDGSITKRTFSWTIPLIDEVEEEG